MIQMHMDCVGRTVYLMCWDEKPQLWDCPHITSCF